MAQPVGALAARLGTRHIPAMVVFIAGCALAVLAFALARQWEERRIHGEFHRLAASRVAAVQKAIDLNLEVLWSIEGLYAASIRVERHEFRAFAGSALARHRAIAALQWAPRIPHAARKAHETEGREELGQDYHIAEDARDGRTVAAAPRHEYFPLYFAEPRERRHHPFGLDLSSDGSHGNLMARAADAALPLATARIPLKPPHAFAVNVFLPIYKGGAAPRDPAERTDRLLGFAVALYRLDGLLDEALWQLEPGAVRLQLLDYSAPPARRFLAAHPRQTASDASPTPGSLHHAAALRVAGRGWSVACRPSKGFVAGGRTGLPIAALATGILFTLVLTGYLLTLAGHTARVERLVAVRTDELSRANDELARSNAELEQFAYVASHDLQEPLRMVSSFVQLLAQRYQGKLDADADEFIGYAVDGATRMQALIRDLLAYSRVGRRGHELAPVDLEAALEQATANLRAAIADADAALTHEPLPTVLGDETQLTQLLQNLIGNAVKFHGTQPPQIHVGARRQAESWIISVRDNGIGIDPDYADRIFLIFQRLHTRAQYDGTGIGLAMCRKIVERHGGRIWLESTPGSGSTFSFTLPVVEDHTP